MNDFYSRAAADSPAPSLDGGASGYFSAPSDTLDPHLFEGETLRTGVQVWLWSTLVNALGQYHLTGMGRWLHAWLAGSGITYQWSADRGNGDLDVLFGVDYPQLLRYNPEFKGLSEAQFAAEMDEWLRTNIWPSTAAHDFNGQTYSVTFYLNPGTGIDIRNIHPYAALDIQSGEWVVRPPEVAPDPESMYPREWFDAAQRDADTTAHLVQKFDVMGRSDGISDAAVRNREVQLRELTGQAQALFAEIHGGRREAFGQQGNGYGDWHNFRWQAAKRSGVVQGLRTLAGLGNRAREEEETELYGGPIAPASEALTRAALVNRTRTQR
jgi:hypothetical protein